jgi:5-formyltetrahydrofolate cyclo-ligase
LPDVIFVPCLAFDLSGYRLGYGGGYYDKILSYFNSLKHKFTVVGLAYDNQKVDEVIHDDLDQKLNYILTEKQLYKIL